MDTRSVFSARRSRIPGRDAGRGGGSIAVCLSPARVRTDYSVCDWRETVRHRSCIVVWLFVLGVICPAAQRAPEGMVANEPFIGTWNGTWEGAGSSGGFELTLEKGKDGPVTGRVTVTQPDYKATFKTLSFDGKKMTATYDFPPDPSGEVALTAVFDGETAKGTWSAREKSTGDEVASGTWTVTRKCSCEIGRGVGSPNQFFLLTLLAVNVPAGV
jgi:hypothetical protein